MYQLKSNSLTRSIVVPVLLACAACSPQVQDNMARSAARSAITPIVTQRFPGVPVEPALDCMINNASAVQIQALAADSVLGPNENTVQIVNDIVSKPETLRCLAPVGLPALFLQDQNAHPLNAVERVA